MRSSTVQKHEGQISNFYFLISTFREQLQFKKLHPATAHPVRLWFSMAVIRLSEGDG
jgi:hypothetical protein